MGKDYIHVTKDLQISLLIKLCELKYLTPLDVVIVSICACSLHDFWLIAFDVYMNLKEIRYNLSSPISFLNLPSCFYSNTIFESCIILFQVTSVSKFINLKIISFISLCSFNYTNPSSVRFF